MQNVRIFVSLAWLMIISNSVEAQSFFKILDKESGATINYPNAELVQDGFINFAGISLRSSKEVFSYTPWSDQPLEKSNHQFFLSINHSKYLPEWIEVDLMKSDTLTVLLRPDPNQNGLGKEAIYQNCGEPIYKKYYPRPFREWEDLPKELLEKVETKLLDAFGPGLLKQLYLSSIYRFVADEMNQAEGRIVYQPGEVGYRICLSYSNPKAGISQYSSDFYVNSSGHISKLPNFPNINLRPSFSKGIDLLDFSELKKKVELDGEIDLEKSNSDFQYFARSNSFVWVFTQIMKENKNGIQSSKSVYYDAETGRKLAIFFDENEFFYHFDGISVALDN